MMERKLDGRRLAALRRGFTDRQQEVWSLREMGVSWQRIAEIVGIGPSAAGRHYKCAQAKIDAGLPPPDPREALAKGVLVEAEKRCLGEEQVEVVAEGLRALFEPLAKEAKPIDPELVVRIYDDIHSRILASFTDEDIRKSSLGQRATLMQTVFEQKRLLQGEATSIVRHEDVRKMDELIEAFAKEAKRRGVTIDAERVE